MSNLLTYHLVFNDCSVVTLSIENSLLCSVAIVPVHCRTMSNKCLGPVTFHIRQVATQNLAYVASPRMQKAQSAADIQTIEDDKSSHPSNGTAYTVPLPHLVCTLSRRRGSCIGIFGKRGLCYFDIYIYPEIGKRGGTRRQGLAIIWVSVVSGKYRPIITFLL